MKTSRLVLGLFTLALPVVSSPAAESQPYARPTYKLRPGDKVSIAVAQEEKLRLKKVSIDAQGDLAIAGLMAPVPVAGLSVDEAKKAIATAYQAIGMVAAPRVSIVVEAYAPRVQKPNQAFDGLAEDMHKYLKSP